MYHDEQLTFLFGTKQFTMRFCHRLMCTTTLLLWEAIFKVAITNNICTAAAAAAFLASRSSSCPCTIRTRRRRRRHDDGGNDESSTSTCCRVIKVTIRIVGRRSGGEEWLDQGCAMYEKRLGPNNIEIDTIWYKNNDALCKAVLNNNSEKQQNNNIVPIILLDPEFGKSCTSNQFAKQFYQWAQDGGSRLVFVIGGADGLPSELRSSFPTSSSSASNNNGKKPIFLSLSDLTFTHQFARLLLTEQIYRASEIDSQCRTGSSSLEQLFNLLLFLVVQRA